MEKFLVTGHSKATVSESCRQFRLSLPIAKHYEPHIVKKGEEQLYPLDIINMAVYTVKTVTSGFLSASEWMLGVGRATLI